MTEERPTPTLRSASDEASGPSRHQAPGPPHRFDAIIVGGGPAGSTCAWALGRAGLRCAVVDKAAFPRDKTCAGWITPAVVKSLQLDTADYKRGLADGERVFEPIRGFRVGVLGDGRAAHLRYAEPVSFGIRRREFDHYLLSRSGAALFTGQPVGTMERIGGGWVINGKLTAPLLVGAGGHFCPVAARLNPHKARHVVVAQELETPLTEAQWRESGVRAGEPELYFCDDLAGYAWLMRKGDYLNVGIGREDARSLSTHAQHLLDWLKRRRRVPADLPESWPGHAYILHGHSVRRVFGEGVLLVGDAAGLAYPESGEGIRPAVESALLAARTAVHAQRDYREENLAPYERDLVHRFGRRDARYDGAPAGAAKRWLAGQLLRRRWFARHVVINRWFLHRQEAALVM